MAEEEEEEEEEEGPRERRRSAHTKQEEEKWWKRKRRRIEEEEEATSASPGSFVRSEGFCQVRREKEFFGWLAVPFPTSCGKVAAPYFFGAGSCHDNTVRSSSASPSLCVALFLL